MTLRRIFAKCKTWRCRAEIRLDDVAGFYFYGDELRYDGPPFLVTCKECGKCRSYTLQDVIVLRGGDVFG